MRTAQTATLLVAPILGVIALVLFEIVRALSDGPFDASSLPPLGMLIGIVCLSTIPVILLTVLTSRASFWVAFVIVSLLALFHGMHILEHVMGSDVTMTVLIFVTMFAPSVIAAARLWKDRGVDST
ncbi:MAG: hypothetical protein AAF417_06090 [Pseudomonadota bacterium]